MDPKPPEVDYDTPLEVVEKLLEENTCVLVHNKSRKEKIGIITDWDLRRYYKEEAKKRDTGK